MKTEGKIKWMEIKRWAKHLLGDFTTARKDYLYFFRDLNIRVLEREFQIDIVLFSISVAFLSIVMPLSKSFSHYSKASSLVVFAFFVAFFLGFMRLLLSIKVDKKELPKDLEEIDSYWEQCQQKTTNLLAVIDGRREKELKAAYNALEDLRNKSLGMEKKAEDRKEETKKLLDCLTKIYYLYFLFGLFSLLILFYSIVSLRLLILGIAVVVLISLIIFLQIKGFRASRSTGSKTKGRELG